MNSESEELNLVTGNANKASEFARLLGVGVRNVKIPLPEIQALDVRDVSRAKALAAFEALQRPVFVDDSGLIIDAWNGLPGALTSWFLDAGGNGLILKMLDGFNMRSASVITSLGYCDENGVKVFTGTVSGFISESERGGNGFGYDAIFIPEGHENTFAEMPAAQKDAISMRARAAQSFREFLDIGMHR